MPNNKIEKKHSNLALVLISVLMAVGLTLSLAPCASAESFVTFPEHPTAGDEFHINITTNESCIAMIFITNSTGYRAWNGTILVTGNHSQIGPFVMNEGNYTVNSTFLYPSGSSNELGSSSYIVSVGPEVEEEDEYSPAYVLLVGMGVVFAVLGLLAIITFLAGKYLPKDAKPVAVMAPARDDNEKIAAIAVAVRNRRG